MASLPSLLVQAVLVPPRISHQLVRKETQVRLTGYLLRVAAAAVTTHIRAQQVAQVAAVAKTSIILQKMVLSVRAMLAAYQIVIGMAAAAVAAAHQPLDRTVAPMWVALLVLARHRVVVISTQQAVGQEGTGFRPQLLELQ